MKTINRLIARAQTALLRDTSGATAIEYGLIAAGISVAIIVAVFAIGGQLQTTFQCVLTTLQGGTC